MIEKLERILRRVEKPARYTGGETHQVIKNPAEVKASVALIFPDVYDIGMSYHGFKILYERINAREDWAAERCFAPWPDMEGQMRAEGIALFTLETKRPVAELDVLGFTLQHEVNFTNVLNLIDLAGLPVESAERADAFPLVIAGGEGALAPEPLSPFIDLFVLGDGEEVLPRLMDRVRHLKETAGIGKAEVLDDLSNLEGVYVPSLYEMEYEPDGTISGLRRKDGAGDEAQPVFNKAVYSLGLDPGPLRPVIPNLRVVHDRLAIEIRRGCARGCRFCSAGMITRPVRERSMEQIIEAARQGIASTGFDEISLLSLSSSDHTCILPTVQKLIQEFEEARVSVSLPSLRVNSFDVRLAREILRVRKTGFTFAPEAGSERLRRVINKPIDRESLLNIAEEVCRSGWRTLKLYFMVGLPTETEDDLEAIVQLTHEVVDIGRKYWKKQLQVNVSLAPFVPKPHTPFQWAAQLPMEEVRRRYEFVSSRLERSRNVSVKRHDPRLSWIEAVLARGDRRVAQALKRAWQLGARFDGWSEHFRFDAWLQAFEECGVDPAFYANRERGEDEVFPWDHISTGTGRAFLRREWEKSLRGETTPDCTREGCAGCEVCGQGIRHELAGKALSEEGLKDIREPLEDEGGEAEGSRKKPAPPVRQQAEAVQRLQFRFGRLGGLKYLSHLDIIKMLQMGCLRAGLAPAYSEGFNPMPKMRFLPPLPLGYESREELFDILLVEQVDPEQARQALDAALPDEMPVRGCEELPLRCKSPEERLQSTVFAIRIPGDVLRETGLSREHLSAAMERFQSSERFEYIKPARGKKKARSIDLKDFVLNLESENTDEDGMLIRMTLSHQTKDYANPLICLEAITGKALSFENGVDVLTEARIIM